MRRRCKKVNVVRHQHRWGNGGLAPILLIYLDHAWEAIKAKRLVEGRQPDATDLDHAIMDGVVERVRPKMMTVVAIIAGLLLITWCIGTGSEVMSRIASAYGRRHAGLDVLTLGVTPTIYALVKEWRLRRGLKQRASAPPTADPTHA